MTDEKLNIATRRILKQEPRNRTQIYPSIEKEYLDLIRANGLDLSNTINMALESYLNKNGYTNLNIINNVA